MRRFDVRHDLKASAFTSILFSSSVESASVALFLREQLLRTQNAELLSALDGAIVLLRDSITEPIFSMIFLTRLWHGC